MVDPETSLVSNRIREIRHSPVFLIASGVEIDPEEELAVRVQTQSLDFETHGACVDLAARSLDFETRVVPRI